MTTVPKLAPAPGGPALAAFIECDRALVAIGRRIRVLKAIDWPLALEERFLDGWRRGQPELPAAPSEPKLLGDETSALKAVMRKLDRGHPVGNWLYKTAWSYHVATSMLAGIGTPEFTRCSALLYGRPDTRYRSQDAPTPTARRRCWRSPMVGRKSEVASGPSIFAEAFAEMLRERIGPIFQHNDVKSS